MSILTRSTQQVQPDEIYNLANQSHLAVVYEESDHTANSNALGGLRILEVLRSFNGARKADLVKHRLLNCAVWRGKPRVKTMPFYPRSRGICVAHG
jgi:GDPmannose 4,6-dehydratase